ncbi:hypothetical protein C0J08_14675 [Marinomonas sp. CT5]|uniref:hypothetical protein n=1 Tax=Marinomonas sp. CT5 TaxID=2066133 RepID=UPI001BAFCF70|nr:hypothetical protein [Marinomonas sp. CT5]QUX96565.1 hypothetical protein C0J08_14675 [Marinomonas sp. CT5]
MTVNPEIFLNSIILLVSIWALMFLNYSIIKPTRINEKRFKLYKIRDDLAVMAIEGRIKENSDEYMILINLINNSIASTKDFEITKFINRFNRLLKDKALRRNIEQIIKKIERDELPDEYRKLVKQYFIVSKQIFAHKSWLLVNLLTPFILFFKVLGTIIIIFKSLSAQLTIKQEQIKDAESYYKSTIQRISIA